MQHYLFVHFREKTSPDGEQVHFAVSRDGFHWQALNGGHPVLWAYYGDRGVRDMTIVRDHTSGKFHIFATDLSLSYGMRNQYQHSWRNIGLNGSRDLAGCPMTSCIGRRRKWCASARTTWAASGRLT